MPLFNLLDLSRINGSDKTTGLIEENLRYAPELSIFPFSPKPGTTVMASKRTAYPGGGFVQGGGGTGTTKSVLQAQLTQMFPYLSVIQVPKLIGMAYDRGMGALEMIEAAGVMKQSFLNLGSQIWNGNQNKSGTFADGVSTVFSDPNGFPGIQQFLPNNNNGPFGAQAITVNAAGTTANTASSVYAVKFGEQDVHGIIGLNSTFELSPFTDQQIVDPNNSANYLPARVASLTAWPGLFIGHRNCIGRIFNLTADNGKGLTDTLLAQLMALFPVGWRPDAIFMSRRSRRQLQVTRTVTLFGQDATLPSGKQATIAPIPTAYDDIPIYPTDSIPDTDALE